MEELFEEDKIKEEAQKNLEYGNIIDYKNAFFSKGDKDKEGMSKSAKYLKNRSVKMTSSFLF